MKKTTGTSVARKVLCSALSAAMVVAFAPAVGAAVGSDDGAAYAAEGEAANDSGQEGKFDLGGNEYHAVGSATTDTTVWINPTKPGNWKSTVGRIEINTTVHDTVTGCDKQAYSGTDFELGDWYSKGESGEYIKLETAPKESGDYYLGITAKDGSFVTGSGYVRVQANVTSKFDDGDILTILSDESDAIADPTKINIPLKDMASRLRSLRQGVDFKVAGYNDTDIQLHGWLRVKRNAAAGWQYDVANNVEEISTNQVENNSGDIYYLHVVGLNDYEGCDGYFWINISDAKSFYGYQFALNGERFGSLYLDEAPADPSELEVVASRKSGELGSAPVQGTDYTVDNKWYTRDGRGYAAYTDEAGNAKKPDKEGEYFLKVVRMDGSAYLNWSEGAQVGYISVAIKDYSDIKGAYVTIPGLENNRLVTSDLKKLPDVNVAYAGKILTENTDYTVSWAKLKGDATDQWSNDPDDYETTDNAVNGTSHILISGVKGGGFSGKKVVRVNVLDPGNLSNYFDYSGAVYLRASEVNAPNFDMQKLKSKIKLSRQDNGTQITLDDNKYALDGKWYTRDDATRTYTALESASKLAELEDGIVYAKAISSNAEAQKDESNCCYVSFQLRNDMNLKGYEYVGTDPSVEIGDDMTMPSIESLQWERWIDERVTMDLAKDTGYTQDDKWYVLDEEASGSDPDNPVYKAIEGNPTAPGQYYVKLTGKAPYAGECYVRVFVDKANDLGSFTWFAGNCYLNDLLDPVKFNAVVDRAPDGVEKGLAKDTDYTVEGKWYEDKTLNKTIAKPSKAGTYYVKLVGKGAYEGSVAAVPVIVMDSYDLANYQAEELTYWEDDVPDTIPVTVSSSDGQNVLNSSCYTVDNKWTYEEDETQVDKPTKTGWYYKTIKGKGSYTGTLEVELRVVSTKNLLMYSAKQAGKIEAGTATDAVKLDVYRTLSNGTTKSLAQGTDYSIGEWQKWNDETNQYEPLSGNTLDAVGKYATTISGIGVFDGYTKDIEIIVGEHVHDTWRVGAVASTCTVAGHDEYWACEDCDKIFSDEEATHELNGIPYRKLAAHTPDGGTIVAAATCTTGGKIEYRCKKCGAVTSTTTTAALGHSFSSGSITWTGGGVSSATGTFTCSRDSSHKETVTASISKTLTVKPTCTTKGTNTYTATATSSTGAKVTSTKTAQDEPALGHAYGPYTITVQPTATTTGVATAKCTHDGCTSTITKTVEKLKSEQAASVSGASVSATVIDAKPATTPNGTNVVGSVAIDKVSASSTATKVEVPETVTIKGAEYAVTSIDAGAFAGNVKVESVKLPDTLASIPAGLFEGCSSLKEATLSSKVTEIPADTFNGTALASVAVPATVTKIGARAFKGTALASVELPASVASVGKDAFKGCGKLVTATLPAALKAVPAGAFDGCSALKGVSLAGAKPLAATSAAPTTVDVSSASTIGANAFRGCKSVTAVDVSAAKTIGAGAFKGTSKLASLKTGSSLKSMGASAFSGAKRLKTLTVTSKKLAKGGVKGALKGSAVKTVKVAVSGSKATKAKYAAKYKKFFTAKNCGKKVNVK